MPKTLENQMISLQGTRKHIPPGEGGNIIFKGALVGNMLVSSREGELAAP